jgi:hypothetical protein
VEQLREAGDQIVSEYEPEDGDLSKPSQLAAVLDEPGDVARDPAHPDLGQPLVWPLRERLGQGRSAARLPCRRAG